MITLKTTSSKIRIILDSAVTTNQMECFASFKNYTRQTIQEDGNYSFTNNTTHVDIVPAPLDDNYQRTVEYISVFNNDTSQNTVKIDYYDGVNSFTLFKAIIASGERVEYQNGSGFEVFTNNGSKKMSINQGSPSANPSGILSVVLPGDVINNNAVANTIQNVTGLSASLLANKTYWFKFIIPYTAAATTTGSRWSVNASAGLATNLSFTSEYSLTSTTTTRNANVQGFDLPAASNATSASLLNNLCVMEGYFKPTADCDFTARFASEVLSSAITAKAGAVMFYQQLN